MKNSTLLSTLTLPLLLSAGIVSAQKPNIILIMCDDMGFSDLGCYGSEIQTPNIDMLGEQGVRFTQFKNAGRSCPSRASLLTGRYQHSVDMGWMTAVDEQRKSYRGELSKAVPTIAEVMHESGYSTYMSGKWHVTIGDVYSDRTKKIIPNGSFPTERGIDRFFGCLSGGGDHYKPYPLLDGTELITELSDDFYYTNEITSHAVQYIEEHESDNPLFMYVAHYAPHRPLQAPEERIEAVRERYEVGYDILREERFAKQKRLGLVDESEVLPIHQAKYNIIGDRPAWEELSEKQQQAWIKEGATFAAMVEIVDDGIGEIVEATKRKGIYDDTIFIFLSDNGATAEGGYISQLCADLNNTPYKGYKAKSYMGGVSSPFIIHCPKKYGKYSGEFRATPAHIIDIMPTILSMADTEYPALFAGKEISAMDGIDITPIIKGRKVASRDIYFEHESSASIISDGWKLVRADMSEDWELYNLKRDPFEQRNLASCERKRVSELEAKWTAWGETNKIFPLENRGWNDRIKYYRSLYPAK
ncbi:MAG: arylsulfatase [Rikenellaceae bacterium]